MKAGDVFRVKYPFVRCEVDVPDPDPEGQGFATIQSWKPGVEIEHVGNWGDTEMFCHAEGEMVLTVVDVHRPGKYPARVFYTRRWVRPDGKEFGKSALHITTVPAFKRRAAGYMHEYTLDSGAADNASPRSNDPESEALAPFDAQPEASTTGAMNVTDAEEAAFQRGRRTGYSEGFLAGRDAEGRE